MMDSTKEEISLCKQVAKMYRKEIKKGDWYNDLNVVGGNLDLCDRNVGFYYAYLNENEKIIPLWTISDCLKFLRERKFTTTDIALITAINYRFLGYSCHAECHPRPKLYKEGKTPLEACLKAVLAVLEEVPSGQVVK